MQRMTRDGRCSLPAEEGITPRRTMLVWGTIVLLAALGILLLLQGAEKLGQENARTAMPNTFPDVNAPKPRRLPRFAASVIGSPAALPFGSGEASREDEVADDAEKDVVREQPARCGTTDYYCQPKVALWERLNTFRNKIARNGGAMTDDDVKELRRLLYHLLLTRKGEQTDPSILGQFIDEWKSNNDAKMAILDALISNDDRALVERHFLDFFSDGTQASAINKGEIRHALVLLIHRGTLFGGQLPDAFFPPGSKIREEAMKYFPKLHRTEELLATLHEDTLSPFVISLDGIMDELDRRGVSLGVSPRVMDYLINARSYSPPNYSAVRTFVTTASIEELLFLFRMEYRERFLVSSAIFFREINKRDPALAVTLFERAANKDFFAALEEIQGNPR